jgi:hypothetical protein
MSNRSSSRSSSLAARRERLSQILKRLELAHGPAPARRSANCLDLLVASPAVHLSRHASTGLAKLGGERDDGD